MKNIVSLDFQRKRFDKVKDYYAPKGLAPQLSIIRIEENLVNGQGTYNFDLKKEILSAVEKNLKRNDLFVTLGLGVFLRIDNAEKPGVAPLLTYAPTGDNGFTTADIEALYNGSLYIATGTTVNINDCPTAVFKNVPETQSGATSQAQFNFENDIKMMAEEIVFAGTQDHTVTVSFPTFASANYAAASGTGKLVFVAFGYRVIGGTNEQYRNDPANPYRFAI